MAEPTLVDQASALLKEINLLYGLASGVLLKYSFEQTKDVSKRDDRAAWLGLLAGIGSFVLAAVLVVLMWPVAWDAATGGGEMKPTLVIFVVTCSVIVVLAGLSIWAATRGAWRLWQFSERARRRAEKKRASAARAGAAPEA